MCQHFLFLATAQHGQLSIFTLDLVSCAYPTKVGSLPYDCLSLIPCLSALGEVVILTSNAVIHVDQAMWHVTLSVNGWQLHVCDMPTLLMMVNMHELCLKGAQMAFVEEQMLLIVLINGTIIPFKFVVMSDDPPPLFFLQDQRKGGCISLTIHACAAAPSQMASINHFISLKTTPPCPADSRAWRSSSRSVVCGPKECQISSPNAQVFVASLATLTAAAGAFSLYSPISFLKKSQLQELVKSCGHLCDFYPKYHCELNFIKKYWGAAKLRFQVAGHMATIVEMKRIVIQCLDDFSLLHIQQ